MLSSHVPRPKVERALVVGAGIIGLTTARCLRRAGVQVVVAAEERGADATSGGAGGYHMPFHIEPMEKVKGWSERTMATYLAEAKEEGGRLAGCIELLPAFILFASETAPEGPEWGSSPLMKLERLTGDALARELSETAGMSCPQEYRSAWRFSTVVVDAPRYLALLEAELESMGADLLYGTSLSMEAAKKLARERGCHAVINCAGLGGADFSGNDSDGVTPGRGVVAQFRRSADSYKAVVTTEAGPLASPSEPAYCIPRGDVVVVGGSYHEGNYDRNHSPAELARIQRNAHALAPGLANHAPLKVWTGLRPVRHAGVRLEVVTCDEEQDGGLALVAHNYGHGGSGWTIAYGCAEELVGMLNV